MPVVRFWCPERMTQKRLPTLVASPAPQSRPPMRKVRRAQEGDRLHGPWIALKAAKVMNAKACGMPQASGDRSCSMNTCECLHGRLNTAGALAPHQHQSLPELR